MPKQKVGNFFQKCWKKLEKCWKKDWKKVKKILEKSWKKQFDNFVEHFPKLIKNNKKCLVDEYVV